MAEETKRVEVRAERVRSRTPRSPFEDYDTEWLEPTDDEVEEWAARERSRREAWLRGPGEEEKRAWAEARRQRAQGFESGLAASGPTDAEVDEWAEREAERRRRWVEGPTDAERREWARSRAVRRSAPRRSARLSSVSEPGDPLEDRVYSIRRETDLASKGAWQWMMDAPYWTWAQLVDAGRRWEEGYEATERPRRIRLYADY
jgi:hypothetical protein